METKSVLQSKRSWFNYGSIIAIGLTAMLADEQFTSAVKDALGIKGAVGLMLTSFIVNQYLTQTSDEKPEFKLPKKKPTHKERLDMLDPDKQADDNYLPKDM